MNDNIDYVLRYIGNYLPEPLLSVCKKYISSYGNLDEVRLRRGGFLSFAAEEKNIITSFLCTPDIFDKCSKLLIGNALYKNKFYINNGIIPLSHGFRAGICGSALITGNAIEDVYGYSSLVLRLPSHHRGCAAGLVEHILSEFDRNRSGLLITSPPCGGKTTFLRDIARSLSTPPVTKRVCVVDTNFELASASEEPNACMDVLSGYPIDVGINIAVKFLNPQFIICDEIGNDADTKAINSALHSGVPFIASAHASSVDELLAKPNIRSLIERRAFSDVAILKRHNDIVSFELIKL